MNTVALFIDLCVAVVNTLIFEVTSGKMAGKILNVHFLEDYFNHSISIVLQVAADRGSFDSKAASSASTGGPFD